MIIIPQTRTEIVKRGVFQKPQEPQKFVTIDESIAINPAYVLYCEANEDGGTNITMADENEWSVDMTLTDVVSLINASIK